MNGQEGLSHRWLCEIYRQDFLSLKLYAYKIIHNEAEAEEIVSNSFAKLLSMVRQQVDKFPTLPDAKAYLAATIKHACFEWRRKTHPVIADMSAEDVADDDHMVFELEKYDLVQQLLALIDELPEQSKKLMTLFFKEGLSTDQVAQKLNMSRAGVSVCKSRTISRLREMARDKKLAPYFGETVLA